ncbi:M16 family metallopeptidase [Longimicrobium terrae]|uniref:Zinc protease n=1 Tax=Longimicrobium terrae TaxID=1639882 RepID=A0A841H2I5_9BACT|nr:insulinase family protein [Longimicrobium terrae]MBB4637935.1 zinc protease [Longimicrobium terrae]MBB6072182.1 zinc protease [Longimicrobium terrae]NNC28392.1 insulinase family protein [Longimicrobium terrae]
MITRIHHLSIAAVLLLGACARPSTQIPASTSGGGESVADTVVQPDSTEQALRPQLTGDTAVITDTLPNGLVYYVRRNAEPRARAELRLVVNAGSVLEEQDQRGLAHFLEHMAFNGTRRFAKHEIVDYLERAGMRFGPDINAYTSFDETVYMLQLPTDSAALVGTGMRILRDWATGISLDSAEIDAERGVVLEEWRRRLGAGSRISDRQYPFLYAGSRYADRLPIGDPELLRTFKPEALRRFYHDWYRPELMAVVAVGDFDARAVEAMIREEFGAIPRSAGTPERTPSTIPERDSTRTQVTVDPELPSTAVSINWYRPAPRDTSLAAYRRAVAESMFAGIIGERMNDISLQPGAPFLNVSSYLGGSLRPIATFSLNASVAQGGAERGLAAMLTELRRAARYGFTADELGRERTQSLRSWEQIYAERAKTTSGQFTGQYVGHFLQGGALRSLDDEYNINRALISRITPAEVQAAAQRFVDARDRVVLVTAPGGEGAPRPTEQRLAAVMDSVASAEVSPFVETSSDAPLLARMPEPGRVVAEDSVPEAGITRWTLSNGAHVVLKPTDFSDDQILFAALSPGGTSLLPDSLFRAGQAATTAVQLAGVGQLSVTELQRRLTGKVAGVGSFVGEREEGMSGLAAPRDVETLFQLVHLYFTQPRRDTVAWQAYLQRGREALRNRTVTPQSAFGDSLRAILAQNDVRSRPYSMATFDSLDLDRSLAIYRQRFADAGGFTFYFVGNLRPDSLRPLVERYLASLPGTGTPESARDRGVRPPAGIVRRTIRRGLEPSARTAIVFTGPAPFSRENRAAAASLADALEIRLREKLRESLGGTYSVSVGASLSRDPVPLATVSIEFGSAPERVDELTRVVFAEIDTVRAGGVPADVVDKVREAQRREKEVSVRENSFWLYTLMEYDRLGWDVRGIDDAPLSGSLTTAQVRDAARLFLDPRRFVQVSLVPEAVRPAAPTPAAPATPTAPAGN